MRKFIVLCLMFCCLLSVTACSKDKMVDQYNHALQTVGNDNLTKDSDLQGERKFGVDSYVGTYTADYNEFSGKEILLGGMALERDAGNKITVSCTMEITNGTAKLLFQTGNEDAQVLCDKSTSYSDTIELPAASNYIIIETENFTGSFDLTVE